jgi:hypothetical protein
MERTQEESGGNSEFLPRTTSDGSERYVYFRRENIIGGQDVFKEPGADRSRSVESSSIGGLTFWSPKGRNISVPNSPSISSKLEVS